MIGQRRGGGGCCGTAGRFPVKDRFPLAAVLGVAVFDEEAQDQVQTVFPLMKVAVCPDWYF